MLENIRLGRLERHILSAAGTGDGDWTVLFNTADATRSQRASTSRARSKLRELGLIEDKLVQHPTRRKPFERNTMLRTGAWGEDRRPDHQFGTYYTSDVMVRL